MKKEHPAYPSQLQNPSNHISDSKGIIDFLLFPNPNSGEFKSKITLSHESEIFLLIVDHMGNKIKEYSQSGEKTYLIDFDLIDFPTGIYALILFSENQERYILFNKI